MDDKIKIGKIFLEKKQRLANKEKQLNKKIEVLEKEIIELKDKVKSPFNRK